MDLMEEVYLLTKKFPKAEQYGVTSQVRRAATGILANIAEGFSRSTSGDKAYKYTIACGECAEVHSLLLASIRLGYLTKEDADHAIQIALEVGRLLSGLVQKYSSQS